MYMLNVKCAAICNRIVLEATLQHNDTLAYTPAENAK